MDGGAMLEGVVIVAVMLTLAALLVGMVIALPKR